MKMLLLDYFTSDFFFKRKLFVFVSLFAVLTSGLLYAEFRKSNVGYLSLPSIAASPEGATILEKPENTSLYYTATVPERTVNPPKFKYKLTIVSSFLDIGSFGKGNPNAKRGYKEYQEWASRFSILFSPLVFYTDSKKFGSYMQHVRRLVSNLTLIVYVNRTDLWSFQQQKKIAAIYASGYPKFWPNTVIAEYTCVMHAKYDFVKDTIDKQYFPSSHVAWLDIGYLREMAEPQIVNETIKEVYVMLPPPDLNSSRVMFGQVGGLLSDNTWKSILHQNINWVAGGFFLAVPEVMLKFVQLYQKAVSLFIELKESQVDQEIIHAVYTKEGRALVQPNVEIQAMPGLGWFGAGLRCFKYVNVTDVPNLIKW